MPEVARGVPFLLTYNAPAVALATVVAFAKVMASMMTI